MKESEIPQQRIIWLATSPPSPAIIYILLVFRVAHALNTPKSRNLVPYYLHLDPKSGGDQPQLT